MWLLQRESPAAEVGGGRRHKLGSACSTLFHAVCPAPLPRQDARHSARAVVPAGQPRSQRHRGQRRAAGGERTQHAHLLAPLPLEGTFAGAGLTARPATTCCTHWASSSGGAGRADGCGHTAVITSEPVLRQAGTQLIQGATAALHVRLLVRSRPPTTCRAHRASRAPGACAAAACRLPLVLPAASSAPPLHPPACPLQRQRLFTTYLAEMTDGATDLPANYTTEVGQGRWGTGALAGRCCLIGDAGW